MILIVSIPIAYAEEQQKEEEELTAEEGYTDLLINVYKYEPLVIVESLLEEQNVPVYVFLNFLPVEGLTFPRVQSISVSAVEGNKSMIAGGIKYTKPHMYSWNDLGYLTLSLKKIEKEEKIPDTIDVELEAKIKYEADVTSHLIAGEEERELYERPVVDVKDILYKDEYSLFGGKGRIQVERISDNSATFVIYSTEGEVLSRFSVGLGKESSGTSLVKGSNIPEDFVRVRVNEIVDATQRQAVINIDNIPHTINVGKEIIGWRIIAIEKNTEKRYEYVELRRNKDRAIIFPGDLEASYQSEVELSEKAGRVIEKSEFDLLKLGFEELKDSFGNFEVKEIKEGEKPEATFNIGKFKLDKNVDQCKIVRITYDGVTLQLPQNKGTRSLRLRTELQKERQEYYTTGEVRFEDELGPEHCGRYLNLMNIDTKKSVKVSILSGKKTGYTETRFWLHLSVEKRPFELSPKALDRQINKTKEQLEKLTKSIDKFEDIIKKWRVVCLTTAAMVLVTNFFSGIGGIGGTGEKGCEDALKKDIAKTGAKALSAETKHKLGINEDGSCEDAGNCLSPPFCKLKGYYDDSGNDVYVRDFDFGAFYIYDKNKENCVPIENRIIFDSRDIKIRNDTVWNWDSKDFVQYTGVKDINTIRPSIIKGENAVIIPIKDPDSIPIVRIQYRNSWKINQGIAEKGLYAVVYKDRVDFWQGRGDIIDVGDPTIDKEIDEALQTFSVNVPKEKPVYDHIEAKYMRKISSAQAAGAKNVNLDGRTYKIEKKDYNTPGLKCECIMAEWKCRLLYNACDPVICPPSRCNFGGGYEVESVIKSGLVGSLTLCAPNFGPWRKGGVLVPFCLTGILASMKNIRSFLQGYQQCLINAKVNKKSTGMCDKIRSIFICEIIWEETLSLFKLKGGILGLLTRPLLSKLFGEGGGEEYTGFSGAIKNSEDTLNYFVSDYGKEISAAYSGRTTDEIKKEVCKSAIAGKFPDLGKFIEEFATPEDPVQYTAYLEEHPYAPTKGESRYIVYYHIYAGNPKNRETINYKVYLRSKDKPFRQVASGSLAAGGFADENVDFTALSGYQEICININGRDDCNLGKIVSSSFGLEQANNWWMEKYGGLAPDIQYVSQCVPETESSTSVAGYLPKVAAKRKCSFTNPNSGLGKTKEEEWYRVGKCDDPKGGKSSGICWEQAGLERYPELKSSAYGDVCEQQGGIWCVNKTCPIGAGSYMNIDDDEIGRRECCIVSEEKKKEGTGICINIEIKAGLIKGKTETEAKEKEAEEKTPDQIITLIKNANTCEDAKNLLKDENNIRILSNVGKYYAAIYETGYKCYDKGSYGDAQTYFVQIINIGTEKSILAYYYYVLSYYNQGDIVTAKIGYNNFIQKYPQSTIYIDDLKRKLFPEQ